jgi:hypothetical protein
VNELVNELMLVISTIASVLAGVTAVAAEIRMRRRSCYGAEAPASLNTSTGAEFLSNPLSPPPVAPGVGRSSLAVRPLSVGAPRS